MTTNSHIGRSIQTARDYLARHPETARYDELPARPLSVATRVWISADGVEPQVLRELVEWADQYSPVSDVLRRVVPTSTQVESAAAGLA